MRISDWSSDVCSSDLGLREGHQVADLIPTEGLDLDHAGAEVGEQGGTEGSGEHPTELHDGDAFERQTVRPAPVRVHGLDDLFGKRTELVSVSVVPRRGPELAHGAASGVRHSGDIACATGRDSVRKSVKIVLAPVSDNTTTK